MKATVWSIFLFLSSFVLQAQDGKYYKQLGLQLFDNQQYDKALQPLLTYQRIHPERNSILLKIGICNYYTNQIEEMERYLNNYQQKGGKENATYLLYYARLLRAKGSYQEATITYKNYLKADQEISTRRETAKKELKQSGLGLRLEYQTSPFEVQNEGEAVNSSFDDLRPIPSPNYEQTFYFSSNRRGNMDIYKVSNDTTIAQTLQRDANTGANEQLLGFGCDGQWLYFRKDSIGIMVDSFSSFQINQLELPSFIKGKNFFFFCDSIILFASNELGGLGGYDLYFCRQIEGAWSEPQNFGNPINSEYDEDTPFLDKDGRTLYFSSNHPNLSLGKFDVLKSVYSLKTEIWSKPENIGTSINSYANESYFSIHPKGTIAYFSSDSWLGNGGWDVYSVHMDGIVKRQLPYLLFDDVQSLKQQQLAKNIAEFSEESLYYRIQVAERPTLEAALLPSNLPTPYIKLDSLTQMYSYFFGRYLSFETAYEWYKEAKLNGWKSATLIAFLKDNPLDESAVKQLKEQYEDLSYFWEYLKDP